MTVHIGIWGGGSISDTHARAAAEIEGVRVAAVGGINAAKVKAIADRHQAAAFSDLGALVGHRPLDILLIGSPSGLHADDGITAARAGLHVLVEKPLDVTVEKADALISVCRDAGVKLGVFFQDRFAPDLVRLKEALGQGVLGRPFLASARVKWWRPPEYYSSSRWRGTVALDGGGATVNQGIHTLDLLLWLLGDVRGVFARRASARHAIEVEDTLVATLEFANGALATYEATTAAFPGYPRQIELSGSEGTVVVRQNRVVAADLKTPVAGLVSDPGADTSSASSPIVGDISGHKAAINDLLLAIRANSEPRCNGLEGRRSVELVEALYRSAAGSVPVEIEAR